MNHNINFLHNFKKTQSYVGDSKSIKYKFENGHCDYLVCAFNKFNNNGKRIRISKIEEDNSELLHFVYKSEDDKFYDINGEFNTIEDLIIASDLYNSNDELNISEDNYFDIEEFEDDKDFEIVKSLIESSKKLKKKRKPKCQKHTIQKR